MGQTGTGQRVVEVREFGGPGVLTVATVPEVVPGPGQAVISVRVADVGFVDTLIRSGRAVGWFPIRPPYIPGGGVAGQVTSVGPGTDPGWAGRRVIAHTGASGGTDGYAEQAVVDSSRLVPVPGGLGFPEAATALHDGATALGLLAGTGVYPGERVLVMGAAGGMGLLLVQLARARGAQVIGAARGAPKLGLIREAGADAAVDYAEPGWREEVVKATGGTGPDVVFDGVGGPLGREAFEITAEGGRFSAHGAASGGFAAIGPEEPGRRGVTVRGIEQVQFGPGEHESFAGRALAELSAGRMKPVIGPVIPLDRAADAHAALETRTALGKTLLTVS
jgi:NADPH2:quinone reductase